MVAAPVEGRVFEGGLPVGLADVTVTGRARLDAIARWLQGIAYLDVADAGLQDLGSWVVRRMRLVVEGFPRFGETVELATFCSAGAALAAERRTTIRSATGLVEAVATWVFLDSQTGRPKRLGPEFEAVYGASAGGRRAHTRLRHGPPPDGAERLEWRFRAADIDLAGHVNNAAYWIVAEELLAPVTDPRALEAEIEFSEPAQAGDAVVLRKDGDVWITAPDGTRNASIAGLRL